MKFVWLILFLLASPLSAAAKLTSFCLVGDCKYADGFTHFNYVNPKAPKGGMLREVRTGSFDSLNPFVGKGMLPDYLFQQHSPLMVRSLDEPYSMYPMIAESLEHADDYSWVTFNINPKAQFSDGSPITSEDLKFSFNSYKNSSSLFMKNLYKDIGEPELLSKHRIRFPVTNPSRKAVSLLAYLRILSKSYWSNQNFSDKHLYSFVTSGPYQVSSVKPGHSIVYQRVPNFWAANLPVNKGRYNFDQIRVDYLRDQHASFEGFKAGEFDIYIEPDIRLWHQAYDFPALNKGKVIRETVDFTYPAGMTGLVFNLRRPVFQNVALRKALIASLDFQWINEKLLYGDYQRFTSFFTGTTLMAKGLPEGRELELLSNYRKELPETVFNEPISPATGNSNRNKRSEQKKIIGLFKTAGYQLKDSKMIDNKSLKPLSIKLLTADPKQERLLLPFKKSLASVGVELRIITLDQSQFRDRVRSFDFDMVDWHYFQSVYPGTEIYNTWSSKMAMEKRSGNVAGVQNPAIDFLLSELVTAEEYKDLLPICRALDRILIHGHYMIPKWYSNKSHFSYWKHLHHPPMDQLFWLDMNNWWYQP
ncbi:hypothetical protein EOPP23_03600 [Endozoicomonas sp. OPT23]|uniref:extracellular solute-binding protein n=1 Tax=Endozoicomonas sp. OPT23 TaxID=2072845 RepID=UPI00129B748D|nr:extracellular solute-binding protein [Endozoicomonas sp. OPT23]MRI32085.1 hypothetical protein [Endozoicomonas sp. OPT23]